MTLHHPSNDTTMSVPERGLRYGDVDGYGFFGMVDETDQGIGCHQCEWRGAHLGLHVAKSHNLTAARYRVLHGLKRSKGLVAAVTREKMSQNAKSRYTDDGPLALSRVPFQATKARMTAALPASAQEVADRDARFTAMRRNSRSGKVVRCEGCGVEFCPLLGISKRRFCGMSCSNRHNRAQRESLRLTRELDS